MTYDGIPNLDDISDSDLEDARRFFQKVPVTQLAARFGLSYGEARNVGDLLYGYCETAKKARAARLAGRIGEALRHEAANEARYQRLPERLRW